MIYIINNVSVPLDAEADLHRMAIKALRCKPGDLISVRIYRRSVDARKKENIRLTFSLAAEVRDGCRVAASPFVHELKEEQPIFSKGEEPLDHPPVIIGFGPAGIFCALALAREGYRPIVLEQGAPMEERTEDVKCFWKKQQLNPYSNIQYGEGGAGTFSDGKLMTRINDPYCRYVLQEFVRHGAPEEILFNAKPHIGTDLLRNIIVSLRKDIISLGGAVKFHCKVNDIYIKNGSVQGVKTSMGDIPCECLIFAGGNAAREWFFRCAQRGISIASKPFSVGVRIEHLQKDIDTALYGDYAGHPALGHAEYQLSHRNETEGRAVYTFCMCPGGVVVPAASEQESIVTNGMSYHSRSGKNANAALVVSVDDRDFGNDPLDGILYQQMLERKAFAAAGSYRAPVQTADRFLSEKAGADIGRIEPTYAIGTASADFRRILPGPICEYLALGLRSFERKISGFSVSDAVMTAPETRTSSPVRILRGDNRESVSTAGLYPCGEGSGYAGGITSSAVDGLRTAAAVIERFLPFD